MKVYITRYWREIGIFQANISKDKTDVCTIKQSPIEMKDREGKNFEISRYYQLGFDCFQYKKTAIEAVKKEIELELVILKGNIKTLESILNGDELKL